MIFQLLIKLSQVGGVASLWGAILGGGGLTLAAEFIRTTKNLETVTFAALLIIIVLFVPEGLIGLPRKLGLPKLLGNKSAV